MFNNPLNRKYQTGGSVEDEGFYSWLKSNVKEFKDYSIDQIKEGVRKMEQTEEGRKASASLRKSYEEYKKSKSSIKSKFADGGKMQSFICKHAHGGNVDCGCGGMVVRAEPGMQLPERRVRRASSRNMEDAPDTGYVTRRRVGYADVDGNRTVYEDAVVDGTSAQTWVTSDGQGGYKVAQRIPIQGGWRDVEYNPDTWQYKAITGRLADYFNRPARTTKPRVAPIIGLFPGSTKSGEVDNTLAEGGIISEQAGGPMLTRRQARELSGLNRGYSRSNFQTAMANARLGLRNQGLRGRILRQAARNMVAGIQPTTIERQNLTDNTVPEIVVNPTIQQAATLAELPTRETLAQPVNSGRRRPDYTRSGDYNTNVDTNVVLDMPVVTSEGLTGRKNRFTGLRRQATPTEPTYSDSVYTNPNTPAWGWSPENMRSDMYQFGPGVPWGKGGLINDEPEVMYVKQGGQIEKHQDDNGIIGHYRNKWSNDWNNIKRGWNNFKDSAIGLVVPTSGTDIALMAAGPMFKIAGKAAKASNAIEAVGDVGRKVLTKTGKSVTIIPEGVYGSEKAAKRALTESAPFISQKGELANEAARNINGLRKWLYGGWYNATTNLPK